MTTSQTQTQINVRTLFFACAFAGLFVVSALIPVFSSPIFSYLVLALDMNVLLAYLLSNFIVATIAFVAFLFYMRKMTQRKPTGG
ncbi:hypothetical protein HYW58_00845 [Candidatus Kaiserbacteria bacterium]|nr:hypothetical protein [Candidatus Kaiserbacteria bacterium]